MTTMLERVESALSFNCPECEAGIGELCVSVKGFDMAHFVHHCRIPEKGSEFDEMRLRLWLSAFGDLLNE
jgi:hypothetical protein